MFRIEMLPAAHGDCLWIEYGDEQAVHRILIDGGPAHTYPKLRERILHLPAKERHFDLLVITHVDADHIEGVIRLLLDAQALQCRFDRIWFNGRDQLNAVPDPAGEALGGLQGELLGMLIADYEQRTHTQVWNRDFDQALVAIAPNAQTLPVVMLPGDCRLTLLSPDHARLLDLKDNWAKELKAARIQSGNVAQLRAYLDASRNLRPLGDVLGADEDLAANLFSEPEPDDLDDTLGRGTGEPGADAAFGGDTSRANGSSIALLLEYPATQPTVRWILAGDAWASVLAASVDKLLPNANARLNITGFKLPHHGSVANITEALLNKLRCSHYVISTSGAIFSHPHARTIDLLLATHAGAGKPRLHFNYLVPTTQAWNDPVDQAQRGYVAAYPQGVSLGF